MNIITIKTEKIAKHHIELEQLLDKYIKSLKERSIIVITSKVLSIIEDKIKPLTENIDELINQEADFISTRPNKYGKFITIKYNALISAAGIDQSNGDGSYVLLPSNPQRTARQIYFYLSKKFKTKKFGIIISDSRSMPLRVGATGVAIGFWGFAPLNSYIGKKDIFGRFLKYEQANIVDALAAIAVLAMGEGNEQTPIVIIEDLEQVNFSAMRPNQKDLKEFFISLEDDIFHLFYKHIK